MLGIFACAERELFAPTLTGRCLWDQIDFSSVFLDQYGPVLVFASVSRGQELALLQGSSCLILLFAVAKGACRNPREFLPESLFLSL